MSAEALLEMTQLWYQCKEQLERTQATLQRKDGKTDGYYERGTTSFKTG